MSGMNVGRIDPATRIFKLPRELPEPGPAERSGASFGGMIKGVIEEAIRADRAATTAMEEFAAGNMQDVHNVVIAANKANLALGLLVEIRNGLIRAYSELSKISM